MLTQDQFGQLRAGNLATINDNATGNHVTVSSQIQRVTLLLTLEH